MPKTKTSTRIGRPPRAEGGSTAKITVRFTAEEFALLDGVRPEGYPMASWARKLILEHAQKLADNPKRTRRKG